MDRASDNAFGEYVRPEISDYGTILEFTASTGPPSATGVPMNTPVSGPPPNFGVLGVS